MLSICSVLGVAPVFPRKKEQFNVEVKIESTEKKEDILSSINLSDIIQ
jgi:hypothetical protein